MMDGFSSYNQVKSVLVIDGKNNNDDGILAAMMENRKATNDSIGNG
jgi:hypothetical protein